MTGRKPPSIPRNGPANAPNSAAGPNLGRASAVAGTASDNTTAPSMGIVHWRMTALRPVAAPIQRSRPGKVPWPIGPVFARHRGHGPKPPQIRAGIGARHGHAWGRQIRARGAALAFGVTGAGAGGAA